eukprot:TRINITY_DN39936_c0_g1_i1.p1 TRINITY_DN39936_c0_g1~~TRINITY_DN39936_c0_g1_i1.p1  ORF type:complete len:265 (+),score=79.36 TRINITY_DN39936_c0_g1_i1:140-934(+)
MASRRILVLLSAIMARDVAATAMGSLKLDNYTLDKFVNIPGLTVLTKFDKSYAYGEKEEAFKELCKLSYPVKNFLISEVPVQEYGDRENEDLQTRFKVKTDEFPAYFLFKGSVENPTKFEGFPNPASVKPATWDDAEDGEWEPSMIVEPTAENLIMWLRKNGIKMPSVGTITELDDLVKRFLADGMKDSDMQEARKLAEEEYPNDKKAALYVKIMEKVKAKGEGYVQQEMTRVQKLLGGKLTDEKKNELNEKTKILNVFAAKGE